MAKRKSRVSKVVQPTEEETVVVAESVAVEVRFSSLVEVKILPFPSRLWTEVQQEAFELYPDPEVPKKVIKTIDGEEEIDDHDDGEYLAGKARAERDRYAHLGDAVLELCVTFDEDKYRRIILSMAKYTSKYLVDNDGEYILDASGNPQKLGEEEYQEKLRMNFLKKYALRTRQDYELLMVEATTKMIIEDEEISARIEFFRGQMARSTNSNGTASGTTEE